MEYDDIDDFDDFEQEELNQEQEELLQPVQEDLVTSLLKDRGIEDSSKISFENDNGEIIERDWNDLDVSELLNILRSTTPEAENGLDEDEIQIINTIRSSNLTPSEFIQHIQNKAINDYQLNLANSQQLQYSINLYSDDELYVMDMLIKMNDLTDEEAREALERAKEHPSLYEKLIKALRNEYQLAEIEKNKQIEFQQKQESQERYNKFAENVYNGIANFNQIADGDLNLTNQDRLNMYEFLTGTDQAGNNWLSKALNDTDTLVKIAWYLLYGDQAIQDLQDYYNSEIIRIKKDFELKSNKPNFTYKPKSNLTSLQEVFDDLDDDF